MRCTKKIIYTENLRNNINEIKKNMKAGVKLCCAVKADGYGNDGINTAKIAEEMGASYLAIATVSEGIELRQNNVKCDLLLLSPCCPEEFQELIENDITPLVFDEETIRTIARQYKTAFSSYPKISMLYASKAFMTKAICQLFAKEGFGFDEIEAFFSNDHSEEAIEKFTKEVCR